MAVSKWFDYSTYMANKLDQMQADYPSDNWTAGKLKSAFENAGFVGDEGAQRHFAKYGANEDVSPNSLFDANYYYQAKALQYYTSSEGGSLPEATVLANIDKYAKDVEGLIRAAGMNAWTHYIKWGTAEGINPSSDFNTNAYMQAKYEAWVKTSAGQGKSMEDMQAAFKSANLNAVEHAIQYGTDSTTATAGEAQCWSDTTHTTLVEEIGTNDDPLNPSEDGKTFRLTDDVLTYTGTSGNDTFVAAAANDVVAAQQIDGRGGTDTFQLYPDTAGAQSVINGMTSIEVVEDYRTATVSIPTLDVSGNSGVTDVIQKAAVNNKAYQLNLDQKMTLNAGSGVAATTVTFTGASGASDAASIVFDSAGSSTNPYIAVTLGNPAIAANQVENLSVKLNGSNYVNGLALSNTAKSITFSGEGNLSTTMNVTQGTPSATIESVEASGNSGGVSLALTAATLKDGFTVKGSSAADYISFDALTDKKATVDLGAGNDSLTIDCASAAGMKTGSTFAGGDGTDTLTIIDHTAFTDAQKAMFTGFEKLVMDGFVSKVGDLTGVTQYELTGTTGNTLTGVPNGAANITISSTGTQLGPTDIEMASTKGDAFPVTLNLDNNGSETYPRVKVESTLDTNTATAVTFVSGGVIEDKDDANEVTFTDVSLNHVKTIVVGASSTEEIDITTGAMTALNYVNASASTVAVTVDAAAQTDTSGSVESGGTLKVMSIDGGSAKDTITTSAATVLTTVVAGHGGADSITLSSTAKETVVLESQSDSTASAYDVITGFTHGTDKVDLTAFKFTGKKIDSVTTLDVGTGNNPVSISDTDGAAKATFTVNADFANGFFDSKAVAVAAKGTAEAFVFVDANGNGNWDAASDSVFLLVGDYTTTALDQDDFIFA